MNDDKVDRDALLYQNIESISTTQTTAKYSSVQSSSLSFEINGDASFSSVSLSPSMSLSQRMSQFASRGSVGSIDIRGCRSKTHKSTFHEDRAADIPENLEITFDDYNANKPDFCPSLPEGFPCPFPLYNPLSADMHPSQFRSFARTAARFRSSPQQGEPSTVLAVNLYVPASDSSDEDPSRASEPLVQSLVLVELHPYLHVLEFVERRLPAVVRHSIGNRLDHDFFLYINGVRFSDAHLRSWLVSDLPLVTSAGLKRLCANPLYGHMLRNLCLRPEPPTFRDLNLTPANISAVEAAVAFNYSLSQQVSSFSRSSFTASGEQSPSGFGPSPF